METFAAFRDTVLVILGCGAILAAACCLVIGFTPGEVLDTTNRLLMAVMWRIYASCALAALLFTGIVIPCVHVLTKVWKL